MTNADDADNLLYGLYCCEDGNVPANLPSNAINGIIVALRMTDRFTFQFYMDYNKNQVYFRRGAGETWKQFAWS